MSSEKVQVAVVDAKPEKPPRVIVSIKLWSDNEKHIFTMPNRLIIDNFVIRQNAS